MSEADYMDDCQMLNLADEHHRQRIYITHEVTIRGEVMFQGNREECWIYRRKHGGFVTKITQKGQWK